MLLTAWNHKNNAQTQRLNQISDKNTTKQGEKNRFSQRQKAQIQALMHVIKSHERLRYLFWKVA